MFETVIIPIHLRYKTRVDSFSNRLVPAFPFLNSVGV